MSTAKNIPYVTTKDGELFPGLLLYLMEGILPMLKVHDTKYSQFVEFLLFRFTMMNILYLMTNLLILLAIRVIGHLLRRKLMYQQPLFAHCWLAIYVYNFIIEHHHI